MKFKSLKSLWFCIIQKLLFVCRFFMVSLKGGEECIVCGNMSFVMPLCRDCVKEVFDVQKSLLEPRCILCGKSLVSEKELCMECRKESVFRHTDHVVPLFGYRLWNKELLFRWKIMGVRSLSPFLSDCLSKALKTLGISVIVPVPPRKGKIKKKGWDQIEELSQFLEKKYGFVVLRILQRNSETGKENIEQKKLNRSERIETIGKSYSLVSPKELKKVLKKNGGKMPDACCIIDDILTTGSTVESCAGVLKEGGVKEISVMSLFTAG